MIIDDLLENNADFAEHRFPPGLRLGPARKTILIGCVDPRVDPAVVLGLELGDGAVIRNIGGRVTPATARNLSMLVKVGTARGNPPGAGWNLIVLQHTDCGLADLADDPALLTEYFGGPPRAVKDPYAAVREDVAALHGTTFLPGDFTVSGLVYDVETGRAELTVPPAPLRTE